MTATTPEDIWHGTSDARAVIRARAATTPGQRLAWLEESLLLALASGALARDRAQRQSAADAWARTPRRRD
ncbi:MULTISPECIES: hypothetical protein [unclassified Ornithinimicrobium]|uniref:hypothetical protein n=1 Tax=unclassified Ornithinimicrobium TaxID=2615080 RepID=UPI003851E78F